MPASLVSSQTKSSKDSTVEQQNHLAEPSQPMVMRNDKFGNDLLHSNRQLEP
jgi:hypothetical protein